MNIEEIYINKYLPIAIGIAKTYTDFRNNIEDDKNYSLADDELGELFDELVLIHMKKTMSEYEWNRITNKLNK